MSRRVDIMAVCGKCNIQFAIENAGSREDADAKAEQYHHETSSNCEGNLRTVLMFDTDRAKGLLTGPETEMQKEVRRVLQAEWSKRSGVH